MTFEGLKARQYLKDLPSTPFDYENIETFQVISITTLEDTKYIVHIDSMIERYTGGLVDQKNVRLVFITVPDSGWVLLRKGERYESNYAHETPRYRKGATVLDFITNCNLFPLWYIAVREKGYSYIEQQENVEWNRLIIYKVSIPSQDIVNYWLEKEMVE